MPVYCSDALREVLRRAVRRSRVAITLREPWSLDDARATFLDIDTSGKEPMLSFLPRKKFDQWIDGGCPDAGDAYHVKGRQSGKPARVAKMVIHPDMVAHLGITDADFEAFAVEIKAAVGASVGRFMVVRGDDIKHWYNGDTYADEEDTYTLSNSCMRYRKCQNYFGIYTDNPEHVAMLVYVNGDDRLLGRALVWDHVFTNRSCTTPLGAAYMDRVYGSDATMAKFRAYADEHGWWRRGRHGDIEDTDGWMPGTSLYVKLPNHKHDTYPYCDTFQGYDAVTGILDAQGEGRYELTSTCGGPHPHGPRWITCWRCGNDIWTDNPDDYLDDDGDGHSYACGQCSYCDGCDSWYLHGCPSCVVCEDCDEVTPGGDAVAGRWCAECSQNHTVCEGCGVGDPADPVVGTGAAPMVVCVVCAEGLRRRYEWRGHGYTDARTYYLIAECAVCNLRPFGEPFDPDHCQCSYCRRARRNWDDIYSVVLDDDAVVA